MDEIKEVTIFADGDSTKLSSWSNVPFFFTETLISKGIKVNRVDIRPSPVLNSLYRLTVWPIIKLLQRDNTYTYFRTRVHFLLTRRQIREAVRKYPESQADIFLTFSFSSNGLTTKPAIQFCDWPYEYRLRYFEGRKPNLLEQLAVNRENGQIEGTDLVFPLFPGVAEAMQARYANRNIFYLGNVVNSLYDVTEAPAVGSRANSLLFVGSTKYLQGARSLLDAFRVLKQEYPDLQLHIIGMKGKDLGKLPEGVTCYGYVDKGTELGKNLYYSLLHQAKVFINTTPRWAAFSATIEAMYFYIPVIVTPYLEFVRTFGREIDFGYYCPDHSSEDILCTNLRQVLGHKDYPTLCTNAHEAVKGFTWSSYIDKLLEKMMEKL